MAKKKGKKKASPRPKKKLKRTTNANTDTNVVVGDINANSNVVAIGDIVTEANIQAITCLACSVERNEKKEYDKKGDPLLSNHFQDEVTHGLRCCNPDCSIASL